MSDFTISVVSHGHGELLHLLLRDLQQLESVRGATVIVTLNTRADQVDPSDYPQLKVVVRRNATPRGFGQNHNAAFRQCSTKWFVVLNPDLRTPTDPFGSLLFAAEEDERIGVVAPLVVSPSGTIEDSVRTNLTPLAVIARVLGRRSHEHGHVPHEPHRSFYWFGGMFLLFRSSAFRAVNGFDERFFLYCEDYDVCARLYLAGYNLKLVRTARVLHDARRDSHRSLRHLAWHLQSLCRVWFSRPVWHIAIGNVSESARSRPD